MEMSKEASKAQRTNDAIKTLQNEVRVGEGLYRLV